MVCDERISRGIEFQMAWAEQRKEGEPNLVLDGVGTGEDIVLVRGAKRMDRLVIVDKQSKVLGRVGREGFICDGSFHSFIRLFHN